MTTPRHFASESEILKFGRNINFSPSPTPYLAEPCQAVTDCLCALSLPARAFLALVLASSHLVLFVMLRGFAMKLGRRFVIGGGSFVGAIAA